MNASLRILAAMPILLLALERVATAAPPAGRPRHASNAARTTTKPPAEHPAQIDLLVASAVTAAEAHSSIAAKVRQQIDLFGHKLVGAGSYLQLGKGDQRRFRLQLKIQVADGVSSLEQICTGDELWIHEHILDRTTLGRIDLRRVRNAQARRPTSPLAGGLFPAGGLPRLLRSVAESWQMQSPTAGKLDGIAVWRLEGRWRPAMLAAFLPDQADKIRAGRPADLSRLPAHVPDRLVLTLGHDDLFPYRIEYLRNVAASEAPSPKSDVPRTLMRIELFEAQFGLSLDPRSFDYNPGEHVPVDQTEDYLKSHGLSEEPAVGARPAKPAKR